MSPAMRGANRVALLSILFTVACTQGNDKPNEPAASGSADSPGVQVEHVGKPTAEVVFETPAGEVTATVEVVRTQRDIQRGLMYRTHMPENAGMLFLFNREKIQSFWMKNTLISLDMIFIRADMTVAGVVANTVPQDKTSRFVDTPSQFVLEMNAGWSAKHSVAKHSVARFVGVEDVPPGVPMAN